LENNKLIPLSIILLAVSIVFGSIWIGNSLKEVANQSIYINSQENEILELGEAAKYLKISEGDLLYLVRESDPEIKYVEINGKYIFSKEGLHQWVKSSKIRMQR